MKVRKKAAFLAIPSIVHTLCHLINCDKYFCKHFLPDRQTDKILMELWTFDFYF